MDARLETSPLDFVKEIAILMRSASPGWFVKSAQETSPCQDASVMHYPVKTTVDLMFQLHRLLHRL